MSRFTFAAFGAMVLSSAGAAQQVPGRDLFEFPLGILAEPRALSTRMAGGLWNPASVALERSTKAELGFAGLTTPQDQGVQLQMVGAEYQVRPAWTASLSYAQAAVADILKTETDPQSLGGEIPYGTSLFSIGAATKRSDLSVGVAARYRWASLDTEHAGAFSLDVGAIAERVAHTPVRIAASTFLLSPTRRREAATYLGAADVPVFSADSTLRVRAGYALEHTEGRGREDYAFGSATYRVFDVSAGLSQSSVFGNVNRRLRLGLGLRYAGYTVAIAREDGAAGLGGSYQFLFTRAFR